MKVSFKFFKLNLFLYKQTNLWKFPSNLNTVFSSLLLLQIKNPLQRNLLPSTHQWRHPAIDQSPTCKIFVLTFVFWEKKKVRKFEKFALNRIYSLKSDISYVKILVICVSQSTFYMYLLNKTFSNEMRLICIKFPVLNRQLKNIS